jgi:hypothetical protein
MCNGDTYFAGGMHWERVSGVSMVIGETLLIKVATFGQLLLGLAFLLFK